MKELSSLEETMQALERYINVKGDATFTTRKFRAVNTVTDKNGDNQLVTKKDGRGGFW